MERTRSGSTRSILRKRFEMCDDRLNPTKVQQHIIGTKDGLGETPDLGTDVAGAMLPVAAAAMA